MMDNLVRVYELEFLPFTKELEQSPYVMCIMTAFLTSGRSLGECEGKQYQLLTFMSECLRRVRKVVKWSDLKSTKRRSSERYASLE